MNCSYIKEEINNKIDYHCESSKEFVDELLASCWCEKVRGKIWWYGRCNDDIINLKKHKVSSNKKRKPKWVTHTIATKEATILNIKSKPSDSDYGKDCCLAPVITGENYEDLTRKVDQYLDELMASINKKYCECTNCKGWGVVEVEDEN